MPTTTSATPRTPCNFIPPQIAKKPPPQMGDQRMEPAMNLPNGAIASNAGSIALPERSSRLPIGPMRRKKPPTRPTTITIPQMSVVISRSLMTSGICYTGVRSSQGTCHFPATRMGSKSGNCFAGTRLTTSRVRRRGRRPCGCRCKGRRGRTFRWGSGRGRRGGRSRRGGCRC
jgi:hypothetical protein